MGRTEWRPTSLAGVATVLAVPLHVQSWEAGPGFQCGIQASYGSGTEFGRSNSPVHGLPTVPAA